MSSSNPLCQRTKAWSFVSLLISSTLVPAVGFSAKLLPPVLGLTLMLVLLSGCLVSPVGRSGGIGATTVTDSNPSAIIAAATTAFTNAGYSVGVVNYPDSVEFDKRAGAFGQAMYGGWDNSASYRATLQITPLPETTNYRIGVRVSRVNEAGVAGFEDSVSMSGLWSAEFAPILQNIRREASNAGGY